MSDDTPAPTWAKPIDWSKPVETIGGTPVRVLATDLRGPGGKTVIAYAVHGANGTDWVGSCFDDDATVLRNVPQKRSGWINIYSGADVGPSCVGIFPSKDEADKRYVSTLAPRGRPSRVACVRVEWEET